ncbi:MAG: YkvA family protein [Pseudomonadota bacterium]
MTLSITIDLSDNDLDHFQEVLKRAQHNAVNRSTQEITDAAARLVAGASQVQVPEFIGQRLAKLDSLIRMVHDRGWALSADDRQRVLTALAYFADPKDVIPDSVPVVGYLDDAIMIELCVRELKHELEAYDDFCSFVRSESAERGVDPATLDREDWQEEHRRELHERMQRRRERDRYSGGDAAGGMFRFR